MARIRRITPKGLLSAVCNGTYYKKDRESIEIKPTPHVAAFDPQETGVQFVIANMVITLSGAELHRLLAVLISPPKPKQEKK